MASFLWVMATYCGPLCSYIRWYSNLAACDVTECSRWCNRLCGQIQYKERRLQGWWKRQRLERTGFSDNRMESGCRYSVNTHTHTVRQCGTVVLQQISGKLKNKRLFKKVELGERCLHGPRSSAKSITVVMMQTSWTSLFCFYNSFMIIQWNHQHRKF